MNLQISQLIGLAAAAGFAGDDLATAVSIALAESGGNPNAYNPEVAAHAPVGYGSFGLWQIYLKAHPEFQGQNLFDPQSNAAAAFSVYSGAGSSFRPWSTFGNKMYLSHVDAVNSVINAQQTDVVATDTGATPAVDGSGGDGSSGSGGGFTPSGTDMGALAIAGGLALWAAFKIFG
jgi:Lysozyme like domain